MTLLLLFLAALAAGAVNSVAGGGTLITFPSLLAAGISPIAANATSTFALVPGSFGALVGYRAEVANDRRHLLWIGLPSLVGGGLGALLVLRAGDALFARLVPWLIFSATAFFILNEPLRRFVGAKVAGPAGAPGASGAPQPSLEARVGVVLFQFVVSLYGGFFGAGMGILMLAAFGMLGFGGLHRLNALKNYAAVCINSVASLAFILGGRVHWHLALLMATGAIIGGYGGAGVARRIGERHVRRIVVLVGLTIGCLMLYRQER